MKQTAVSFGPQHALVGVLTEPEHASHDAPVMLLFNAGLLPRQGPHRINVRLARTLAGLGMTSFRLDLSGLGDSRSVSTETGSRAQAVQDLKAAMDWLQQSRGTKRFLVFGVCSGAVTTYDLAQADDRVEGILMFDGFWYRSQWTTLVRYWKQTRAKGWKKLLPALATRIGRKLRPGRQEAEVLPILMDYQSNPQIETFAEVMDRLADRGVDVQIVYSGSVMEFYSYEGQFGHVFGRYPFYPKVRCSYVPGLDHTFVTKQAQQRILDLVGNWAKPLLSRDARS